MPDASPVVATPNTTNASAPTALASAVVGTPPASAVTTAQSAQPPSAQVPVVPEKYDLKMPEGSPLDKSYVDKIASYAKEQGLSNEQAQKVLEREHSVVSDFAKKQQENHNQLVDTWAKQVESDNEIGGQNYKQNVELASRVVKRFGSDTFIKGLNDTGFGNHPEFVRVFTRIGKAMSDDQLVMPGSQPAPKREIADVFYGSGSKT